VTVLADVLDFAGVPERIREPENERFVTLKLKAAGAVQRVIKDGKTPVPFTGYRIAAGQFIYSRIDARNGAFALVPDALDGAVVSKDFPIFNVRFGRIEPSYLLHLMRAGVLQDQIRASSFGATNRQRIAEATLLSFQIPLPPLPEQRRIATILDHADSLRTKRRQVLTHLDSLIESVFRDMFAEVPATSTVAAEASLIRTGPFGSQLLHSEFVDEGIAVLGLDNVVGNKFRWAERRFITPEKYEKLTRYTVNHGDVLISIMGTTGRCVVVPDDIPTAINTKHICAITPETERLNPEFLRAAFLWHPDSLAHLRRQTKGSIMDGLNMGIIKAMPIPVPPLSTQTEFAVRLARIESEHETTHAVANHDDELFTSLQSRAFRGDL